MMRDKSYQTGFTLVELLISMVLTLLLVSGVGGALLAIKQTVRDTQNFENAQEVLRSSRDMLGLSLKRAATVTIIQVDNIATLDVRQDNQNGPQPDCLGKQQATAFTEQFRLYGADLQCRVQAAGVTGPWSSLITGFHALDFSLQAGNRLVRFRLSPKELPGKFPKADLNADAETEPYIRLDIALKSIILTEAT
jgi:prepilin-type N-terminal cleavage/methylation domain-containing protein